MNATAREADRGGDIGAGTSTGPEPGPLPRCLLARVQEPLRVKRPLDLLVQLHLSATPDPPSCSLSTGNPTTSAPFPPRPAVTAPLKPSRQRHSPATSCGC